jgi:branched-chain amino acid transport system substrate-binding protein
MPFGKKTAVALAATLMFSAGAALADEVLKIGVVGPFTGQSSMAMGESIRGAARLFIDDLNASGGIMGRRVELIERDDKAIPNVGVEVAKDLVEKHKVIAAVGYANTGVALPSSKIFQDANIPLIVTAATGAAITKQFLPPQHPTNYIFRTAASDAIQPVAILNDVLDRRNFKRVAVLHDTSPYGNLGRDSLLAELTARKISPVIVDSFKVGDSDMTSQLKRAKDAGADVIVTYSLGTEAAHVMNSAKRMNWSVPVAGPWGLSQKTFLDAAGGNGTGARMPVTFVENTFTARSSAFVLGYRRVNGADYIPSAVAAAQTYDGLLLLVLAIHQAGSTEGAKIVQALENLQRPVNFGIITTYRQPFTKEDHEAITTKMLIMGEIREGRVGYAYAEDAKREGVIRQK